MARSLASLVQDQAKRVADTAESLATQVGGNVATPAQEELFRNIIQQLMAIRDQLASELQQAREIESTQSEAELV
jgi:hypothetical protein